MINSLLTPEWLARLSHFSRIIVGFSGGLDSTVLLHVLASYPSLHSKLVAVHINHGISPNALSWQMHCKQFCEPLNIELITESVHFDRSANIEEGARIARYAVFSSLLDEQDALILGHHVDDQAETVLLQLFRGAGVDGLAAMAESGFLGKGGVVRPFLSHPRFLLEQYAAVHQLNWIDDESNQDVNYSRNYLRHQIMPLLAEKWPGAVGALARTAKHCQQAKSNLDALALLDCPELSAVKKWLLIEPLQQLNFDRLSNVLRFWLKQNQISMPSTLTFNRLIHELIFASEDAVPEVSWGTIIVRRYQSHLYLEEQSTFNLPSCTEWSMFPLPLLLEHITVVAKKSNQGLVVPEGAKITIKFRQGGEEFKWHGQTKRLKKLFQEWEIPPWLRERTPLLYIDGTLAAVVGYAVSDLFLNNDSTQAWSVFMGQVSSK